MNAQTRSTHRISVGRRFSASRREAVEGLLCITPWLLGFVLFVAGPMLASVWLAMTDYEILRPISFIGLGNFTKALQDPLFTKSLWNTAYYTALYVPLHLIKIGRASCRERVCSVV